jgi:hypothetical protein
VVRSKILVFGYSKTDAAKIHDKYAELHLLSGEKNILTMDVMVLNSPIHTVVKYLTVNL